jgi:AhpD family alkylhydroperoxidase
MAVTSDRTTDHAIRRRRLREGYGVLADAIPGPMQAFGDLHRTAMADGALSTATKEMMALVVGIVTGCDDCITMHVHDALRAGATRAEVHEAIAVALTMGGGPASTYATHAMTALDDFAGDG